MEKFTLENLKSYPLYKDSEKQKAVEQEFLERGAIPKDKLIKGKTYLGTCRNSDKAVWNGKMFEYERYKFGFTFVESIPHFQDKTEFDVFVPIIEVDDAN